MHDIREDVVTLIKALGGLAGILSKHGYIRIANVYAKDGLREALRFVETAKKNMPGERPRLYKTVNRPFRFYKGFITVKDRHVALGLSRRAPKDLPLDLYLPEPTVWIGYKNVEQVLENIESVMEFLRRYSSFLGILPKNIVKETILRVAKGEEAPDIIKRCALPCLRRGLCEVASSLWMRGVAHLCGLNVVGVPSYHGTHLRVVDLEGLKVSKEYKPSEMADLLLKKRRSVEWEGDLIEVLRETKEGREP